MTDSAASFVSASSRLVAWLRSGSTFYLLSAALIMGGLFRIIPPLYETPDQSMEKFACLGVLNLYELALLSAALLIVLIRQVYDDAVALTVLISLFLVASAMALDTVAPDSALPSLLCGAIGLGLAFVKLHLCGRHLIGPLRLGLWIGLTPIMLWNFLMPAVLGFAMLHHVDTPGRMPIWANGWWLVAAGGLGLAWSAAHLRPRMLRRTCVGRPLLRTPLMRWIVLAIILTATLIHQLTLALAFILPVRWGDFTLAAALIALVALPIHRAWAGRFDCLAAGIFYLPLVCVLIALGLGEYSFPSVFSPAIVCHPSMTLILFAAGALVTVRSLPPALRAAWLIPYALVAVATFGPDDPGVPMVWPGLNWASSFGALGAALAIIAIRLRQPWWALASVGAFTLAGLVILEREGLFHWVAISELTVAAILFGGLSQVVILLAKERLPYGVALILTILFTLGVVEAYVWELAPVFLPHLAAMGVMLVISPTALIARRPSLALPALIPWSIIAWRHTADHVGWVMVATAFAVLAAGLIVSWRRGEPPANVCDVQNCPKEAT